MVFKLHFELLTIYMNKKIIKFYTLILVFFILDRNASSFSLYCPACISSFPSSRRVAIGSPLIISVISVIALLSVLYPETQNAVALMLSFCSVR